MTREQRRAEIEIVKEAIAFSRTFIAEHQCKDNPHGCCWTCHLEKKNLADNEQILAALEMEDEDEKA